MGMMHTRPPFTATQIGMKKKMIPILAAVALFQLNNVLTKHHNII
jgi:hypothetical protein